MANDLNRCDFIGRLGADPETRYTSSGNAVTNIRIACGWKSKDKEGTEWVPIVFFGKLAEIAGEYLKKGAQVYVSGQFKTRKWQDQSGQDRYTTEIVGNDMQMLGGKSGGQQKPETVKADAPGTDVGGDDFDDMIPF